MFVLVYHKKKAVHVYVPNPSKDSYNELRKIAGKDDELFCKLRDQVDKHLLSQGQPIIVTPPPGVPHYSKPVLSKKDEEYMEKLGTTIHLCSEEKEERIPVGKCYDLIQELHQQSPYKEILFYCCQELHLHEQAWELQQNKLDKQGVYELVYRIYKSPQTDGDFDSLLRSWKWALGPVVKYTKEEFLTKCEKKLEQRAERAAEVRRLVSGNKLASITIDTDKEWPEPMSF